MPSIATLGFALVAAVATVASAQTVSGKPEGYGSKATGGVNGKTVTPTTTDELKAYLESPDPLTVVLSQTFDFRGTEGRTEEVGCAPFGTGPSCQLAIDMNGWCGTNPKATVSYDNAAIKPIEVKSDKTIIGVGQSGVILGKGLRLSEPSNNVIIQNIEISELNPHLTWGGDAIALDGSSNVWISHVTTSLIGRQHIVTGNTKNTGVTISDHFINGTTSWSASCNSYHYWAVFMTGEFDTITFKNNYIYHTGGRAPKLGGAAVVHMANNYWDDIDGHAFEGENAYALVEGNVFDNVKIPVMPDNTAAIYTPVADDAACEAALGRPCVVNSVVGSSGEFRGVDASAYSHVGKNAVDVVAASEIEGIPGTAGNTL